MPSDRITAFEAVRYLALRDVYFSSKDSKNPLSDLVDPEYGLRRACRWFSEHCSTPLADVERLPILYVLQHFWEGSFGTMDNDELEDVVRQAKVTEEDLRKIEMSEDYNAAKDHEEVVKEKKTNAEQAVNPAKKNTDLRLPDLKMATPKSLPTNVAVKFQVDEIDIDEDADLNGSVMGLGPRRPSVS